MRRSKSLAILSAAVLITGCSLFANTKHVEPVETAPKVIAPIVDAHKGCNDHDWEMAQEYSVYQEQAKTLDHAADATETREAAKRKAKLAALRGDKSLPATIQRHVLEGPLVEGQKLRDGAKTFRGQAASLWAQVGADCRKDLSK